MGGCGIKDIIWCHIYATDFVDKMLTGHTFARALCAHYFDPGSNSSRLFSLMKLK